VIPSCKSPVSFDILCQIHDRLSPPPDPGRWPIPDEDLSEIQHGFPFGYYGNGGLTTAQTRHVVAAMYRVGMEQEADEVLRRICGGLGSAEVFGGAKSGIDARSWDSWEIP